MDSYVAVVKQRTQVKRYFVKGDFNPRSTQQLLGIMGSKGDQGGSIGKAGKASTDKKTLEALAKKDPFYRDILDYRAVGKIRGTYCDGVQSRLDEGSRVHGEILHRPSTMRLSMRNPNLTNVVADKDGEEAPAAGFRQCIVASPGCELVEADAAAVEAVFWGYKMKDPDYIRLAQLGVHDYLTSHMVGKPADMSWPNERLAEYFQWIKANYKKERVLCKTIVHASNFGQSPYGMVKNAPDKFTLKSATELQQLYFKVCTKVKQTQDDLRVQAHKQGYLGLDDHPWKYRHWFWDVFSWDSRRGAWSNGSDSKRVVAYYPQSTNAGFLKEVSLRVAERANTFYFGRTPIRALIHDSILCEVETNRRDELVKILAEEMTRPIKQLPCPKEWNMGPYLKIGVEVKVGSNWQDMTKVVLEASGTSADTAVHEWEEDEDAA